MKKNIFFIKFGGYVFVSILGTLLHFLYDWTKNSIFVAPFSAVNESIFEHIKLLYFPLVLWMFIERFLFKLRYKNFYSSKAKSITLSLLLIPTLYYTYTGALGVYADWFNILIFFICGAIAFIVDTKNLKNEKIPYISQKIYLFYILILGAVLIILTFFPMDIPLFIEK